MTEIDFIERVSSFPFWKLCWQEILQTQSTWKCNISILGHVHVHVCDFVVSLDLWLCYPSSVRHADGTPPPSPTSWFKCSLACHSLSSFIFIHSLEWQKLMQASRKSKVPDIICLHWYLCRGMGKHQKAWHQKMLPCFLLLPAAPCWVFTSFSRWVNKYCLICLGLFVFCFDFQWSSNKCNVLN